MSNRFSPFATRSLAFVAVAALTAVPSSFAQNLSGLGGPARTTNERVATEGPAIPSATGDAARIAAQQRPGVAPSAGGRDVAMLVEHAVGMAIEGSNLLAIAGPTPKEGTDLDSVRRLRNKAQKLMTESQSLLGRAAADSQGLAAFPAIGRFHSEANLYITTLTALEPSGSGETAQIAMINQAVKDVLDADHIREMAPIASGSPPLEQLRNHAALMKTQGMDLLKSMDIEPTSGVSIPANVATLAKRGRQLLDAAEQMNRVAANSANHVLPNATGPGRFQNNRAVIIGGTYSTGDPRVGTYQTPASSTPAPRSEPGSIPDTSHQTTGSTGGLRPQ
jgi:hypothetical protein